MPLTRPPGWEPDSWGYHGDDGEVYCGANVGKKYGQRFGPGDFVGCGVNFRTRKIFFTRNGSIQNSGQRELCCSCLLRMCSVNHLFQLRLVTSRGHYTLRSV